LALNDLLKSLRMSVLSPEVSDDSTMGAWSWKFNPKERNGRG